MAFHENGKLRYAGRVGTGYTQEIARDLWQRLQPLRIDRPPVTLPKDERRKNVIWVKPQVVVETEFRGLTHDGLLRQAAYKGLREDKPAREVVRETPAAAPPFAAAAQRHAVRKSPPAASTRRSGKSANRNDTVANVHLTHPDRVYWADVGVTKQDLADYYVSVWDVMAPHVVDRPLAIVRAPEGVGGETFFQKHIASTIKDSPLRHVVDAKEHDVIAVEKLDDLIALVQSGALEVHTRGSTARQAGSLRPHRVRPRSRGGRVVEGDRRGGAGDARPAQSRKAQKLRKTVRRQGRSRRGADRRRRLGHHQGVCRAHRQCHGRRCAAALPRQDDQGAAPRQNLHRLFPQFARGDLGRRLFDARAAGAPVSMPLSWEALSRTTGANQFTVLNAKKQLRGDAWAEMGKVKQKLPR